ncbi:MAG: methylated-DNA--[protein]-cysteine S-methyltransferase [Rhodoferax sp.]
MTNEYAGQGPETPPILASQVQSLQWDGPLGPMLLAQHANHLLGLWFVDQRHAPAPALQQQWQVAPHDALLARAVAALQRYFAQPGSAWDLPLHPGVGSPFQRRVWQALRALAPGQTTHYGALAQQIGAPQAARAVGAAVGRNPWSIVVPCHRVLGARGGLTGYAGGLQRKAALLALEADQGLPAH